LLSLKLHFRFITDEPTIIRMIDMMNTTVHNSAPHTITTN